MRCNLCGKGMERPSTQARIAWVLGYEVTIKTRKMTPGNGEICDGCFQEVISRALLLPEENKAKTKPAKQVSYL